MPSFQHTNLPLPRIWLMSDERLGESFLDAVKRLPTGAGIIFRHYSLPQEARRKLFRQTQRIARRRGYAVFLSDNERDAISWKADGWHNRNGQRGAARNLACSMPVHNPREILAANRARADLVFLSPLYPTKSHAGAKALGGHRFAQLVKLANMPAVALGGMTRGRAAMLDTRTVHGWAAISEFQI